MEHLKIRGDSFALGKTKIFVRLPQTIFSIEDAFQERKNQLVTKLIAVWRGQRQRRRYQQAKLDIVTVQTQIRGFLAQKHAAERRRAVRAVREFIKGFISRHGDLSDVNRKFWLQTRMNYLNKLAKSPLPRTVLDKSWPQCPPSMQQTSDLLQDLHMKNRILKYCKGCSTARKDLMEEKVLAERLFKGKKLVTFQKLVTAESW
jgi:myosin I